MNFKQLTNHMPDWLLFHWMTFRQNQAVDEALRLLWQKEQTVQEKKSDRSAKVGINLIGFVSAGFGLGEAARSTIRGADDAGIPLNIIDVGFDGRIISGLDKSGMDPDIFHPVTVVHFNPDMTRLLNEEPLRSIWRKSSYRIGFWFWETTQLPELWIKASELFDEVWVGSTFCRDVISSQVNKPVTLIPLNIVIDDVSALQRNKPPFPPGPYTFLTMMDCKSRSERKNPFGAIEAFEKAFGKHPKNVRLVVKVINTQGSNDYKRFVNIALSQEGIVILNQLMTRAQVSGLMHAVNCLVSLHRSEGFGLPIAEAMSLGKPVIATGWSANMDFMTEDNSFPVRYSLGRLRKNAPPYPKGTVWAEPDINHAAEIMAGLAENPEMGFHKGKKARQHIRRGFDAIQTGQMIVNRLNEMGNGL
jgi:glycosyltransferase involved in cell wall biosynthesis